MCGIAGFFNRTGNPDFEIGKTILRMLDALACRGPDSSGVALYGGDRPGQLAVRVKVAETQATPEAADAVIRAVTAVTPISEIALEGALLGFQVSAGGDAALLAREIEAAVKGREVVSMGMRLEIAKQVGSPRALAATYPIERARGSHGLGHTRLSTESAVDLSHSQPFWAHGYPDLAIVHNGHITNYHQLRRRFEQHGVHFFTENDSEVVGIYLATRLRAGRSLEGALQDMLRDLDGSYSCLVSTASEMGFVKDPFAFKPLVVAETGEFVAVATEEIAIRAGVPGEYRVREAQTREVRVWRR